MTVVQNLSGSPNLKIMISKMFLHERAAGKNSVVLPSVKSKLFTSVWVQSTEEAGAGRSTKWAIAVTIFENCALARKAINIWGLGLGVPLVWAYGCIEIIAYDKK